MKMGVQAYSSSYVPQRHSEETSMDPARTFCPNMACPARGQTGQGNIGIHSCKDKRFICTACRKTFSATQGTALLSPADLCRNGEPSGDVAGPWVSPPRDRRRVWL